MSQKMQPKFFRNHLDFIKNRINDKRSHYLLRDATLNLCAEAVSYNYYIVWYECGILHEKNGIFAYEGHDTWGAILPKIENVEEAEENNLQALESIKEDIINGYDIFAISLKEF